MRFGAERSEGPYRMLSEMFTNLYVDLPTYLVHYFFGFFYFLKFFYYYYYFFFAVTKLLQITLYPTVIVN